MSKDIIDQKLTISQRFSEENNLYIIKLFFIYRMYLL